MSADAFSNALLNGSIALIGAALALGAIFKAAAVRASVGSRSPATGRSSR